MQIASGFVQAFFAAGAILFFSVLLSKVIKEKYFIFVK